MAHEFSSHSNRPWECRHCKGERAAEWHSADDVIVPSGRMVTIQDDRPQCTYCQQTFGTFDEMQAHEWREH